MTLTTDFGLADSYVAEMKAVVLSHCPVARLLDVTHQIRPQDVLAAALALERMLRICPAGTVHLAVVDPGVGTERALLIVEIMGQLVICPDNGLVTWAWRRLKGGRAMQLTWRPQQASATFHGRDIMAVVAGRLAARSVTLAELGAPKLKPVLLPIRPAEAPAKRGVILHIDHFGNATTNVPVEALPARASLIRVAGKALPLLRTYASVAAGKALALVGSSGLVEIAVRNGSAARKLKLRVGMKAEIGIDKARPIR